MLDLHALYTRAVSWQKWHPPSTGYTERVFRLLRDTPLPLGENAWTQAAAQYTGREESTDAFRWDKREWRLPYSQTYRFSLDKAADCSSFWYVLYRVFFDINIGTYTEAQYIKLAGKKVPWAQRRVGDHVLYNFKAGRNASHAANIVKGPDAAGKGGWIGHTTSPSNPFRFESDAYNATKRLGYGKPGYPQGWVYRVLTDAQYLSLFAVATPAVPFSRPLYYTSPPMTGDDVAYMHQQLLKALTVTSGATALLLRGWLASKDPRVFGGIFRECVKWFERTHGYSVDGVLGETTYTALAQF